MSDVGRVIGFWMRKVRDLRIKLALANADYDDLRRDFSELNDRHGQVLRQVERQLTLFLRDGERNRVIVALAEIDRLGVA